MGIIKANITIDMWNGIVTYQNIYVKLYYCYTKEIVISYLKITNNQTEKPKDKPANKQILTPFDYLESQRICQ